MKDTGFALMIFAVGVALCLAVIAVPMWLWPSYNIWAREMNGKAELAEATWNRQIKVEEAQANLESEKLNAQAEVERAKGAADAIKIEGGNLSDNYIKYLWVRQLSSGEKQLIYVPTEAGLPLLESTRLIK